ncbi:MAG: hypothetical protein AAF556_02995, partial [Pseudomonadota bacterium]
RLRQGRGVSRQTRYAVLLADSTALLIRFSPKIIAELQARDALLLTLETLPAYLAFYWRFTGHGRTERWLDPATLVEPTGDGGWRVNGHWIEDGQPIALNATVMPDGQVLLEGEG